MLLSIADEPVPPVFHGPTEQVGFAAAFLLGGAPGAADPGCTAELAIVACGEDPEDVPMDPTGRAAPRPAALDPRQALARVADAWARRASATIALGPIQPGALLELRVSPRAPEEVRA